jgi:hypothetical protein
MSNGFPIMFDSSKLTNVNSSDFSINFSPNLFLGDGRWEMALIKAFMWYSFYNIDTQYENTTASYSPDNGGTWKDIDILPGQYSIEQLNDRIHAIMKDNGDYTNTVNGDVFDINILADYSTLKIQITISNNYRLDLTGSDLNLLLGFDKIIVTSTQLGSDVANINNNVNSIKINCDILTSSYDNSSNSNCLYSFSPNSGPGSQIVVESSKLIFIPVIPARTISSIRVTITDQTNRVLDLHDEPVTIFAYLRPRKNI